MVGVLYFSISYKNPVRLFLDNIVLHKSCPLIKGTFFKYIHRRARLSVVFTKNELGEIFFVGSRLRKLSKHCLHFLQVHESRARSGKI